MDRPLRIAQVAPPFEAVPPAGYGGTERIVHGLVVELVRRGHDVTTFASADSNVPGRLIPTVPAALRPIGYTGDSLPYMHLTMTQVLARASEFDLVHCHLEWASLLLARTSPVPVVTTFHGRLDLPWAADMLRDAPDGLVAISRNQASTHPSVAWAGIVHNGLSLEDAPFEPER
ncbi:MAG: glycosyltransferase, partial [Candidatus Limnocylindrales bacterium]